MFKSLSVSAAIIISSLLLIACSTKATPPATAASPVVEESTPQPELTAALILIEEPTRPPEPTAVPSVTAEPTAILELTPSGPFLDSGEEFVITNDRSNSWESSLIFTAGIVEPDREYYQYYTGIGRNWPEDVGIGVTTSSDGVTWERASGVPPFTAEGIEFAVETILGSSALRQNDGPWVLYFYSIGTPDNPQQGASWIGRATSDNPFGPFVADAEPVLLPGGEGSWDSERVLEPSVLQTQDGWVMLYVSEQTSISERKMFGIGYAHSQDGLHWERGSTEPLVSTAEKSWNWLYTISVREINGLLHAYYSGQPSRAPATTNVYTLTQIGDLFPE